MNISGYHCLDESGSALECDAHGYSVAVCCTGCGHPLLLTAVRNKKGSSETRTTACPGCSELFYIKVVDADKVIRLVRKT